MQFWSSQDRQHYLAAMTTVLGNYLLVDEAVAS